MNGEDMPTAAQWLYLRTARDWEVMSLLVCQGDSNLFWNLWSPGDTSTGRACLRRGWIQAFNPHIGHGPYQTSAAGRDAMARFLAEVGAA